MNKMFSNTVKKTTLWATISAVLLAAAIVVCALFGFNKSLVMKDCKTLTVSLNAYVYNTQLDEVKGDLAEKLDADYIMEGAMTGDVSEIVFVFNSDADVAAHKTTVENYLKDKVANEGGWATAKYSVSVSTEKAAAVLAEGYVVRAAIAGVVLAVLAFVYVSLRYQFKSGIVVGVSALLAMLLTASIVVLTRVYVTAATAYVITFAGLLTTAMSLLSLNNFRAANKENNQLDAETIANAIAVKEVLYTAVVLAVGSIVGVLGGAATVWFAAAAVIAVLASVFAALIFAPAMYCTTKAWYKAVKSDYVGAQKIEKE